MDERRQYVRFPSEIHMAYTIPPSTKRIETTTVDVGAGGLRVVAQESVDLGARLQIEMTFPGAPSISFTGEVVSCKPYKAAGSFTRGFALGVRIVEISPTDRAAIKEYVSSSL